jgi:hypothetical protein
MRRWTHVGETIPPRGRAVETAPRFTNGHIHVTTDQEWRALVDRAARHYLGMSADEFVQAWERGEFIDPDRPEILRVAMLLPVDR